MNDRFDIALSDFLAPGAALARAMESEFDPRTFLAGFSEAVHALMPHERTVLFRLSEDGRAFTVFAAHGEIDTDVHRENWTTAFKPDARFIVKDWVIGAVFSGVELRIDDVRNDPRLANVSDIERPMIESGLNSGVLIPLYDRGRVVGALGFGSRKVAHFDDERVAVARRIATLVAPIVQNAVLVQRERRRRERMAALHVLSHELGSSLDVSGIFARLGKLIRPVLDCDILGVALASQNGPVLFAEVDLEKGTLLDQNYDLPKNASWADKVRAGESVLFGDTHLELDRTLPGDRKAIADGTRAALSVPLFFGERVAGTIYVGKRFPYWYDSMDIELAQELGVKLVLAIQHQRLAEDQRLLHQAAGRAKTLERRVEILEDELDARFGFDRIVGRSKVLREVIDRAAKVAPTDTTVLITGESGTGKELFARAIHVGSPRASGPFVAINCAALPEALLESELFGHEKGAFTGADKQKPGRFEQAAGGSLFLDEVGELAPAVQAKLLRVIQEREFQRVGGTQTIATDVRLITATNRDLGNEAARGKFRDDLYWRLQVFSLALPPLRGRSDDVLLLADHFVKVLESRMGKSVPGLSRDARDVLVSYPWPGNIRELQNAIERAMILSDGGLIHAALLGLDPTRTVKAATDRTASDRSAQGEPMPSAQKLPEWERKLVVDALERAGGNKSRAAELLGVTRSQLYTRMKRFGLGD